MDILSKVNDTFWFARKIGPNGNIQMGNVNSLDIAAVPSLTGNSPVLFRGKGINPITWLSTDTYLIYEQGDVIEIIDAIILRTEI